VPAWYAGGYAQVRDDDGRGLQDRSYLDYVKAIVARYATSPAVAFWEPVNEPEASTCTGATGPGCWNPADRSCPSDAATVLRGFYDTIGATIRRIDPYHLISLGTEGGGQCGITGDGLATVASSAFVDLVTYHDYNADHDALPDGLSGRLQQSQQIGRPLIVEEAGINGGTSSCYTDAQRAQLFAAKVSAAFGAGAVGYLPWWYADATGTCGNDFAPGDPLLDVLRTAPS
jgi:hypothetical protein